MKTAHPARAVLPHRAGIANVAGKIQPHPRKRDVVLGGQAGDDTLEDIRDGGRLADSQRQCLKGLGLHFRFRSPPGCPEKLRRVECDG